MEFLLLFINEFIRTSVGINSSIIPVGLKSSLV